MHEHAQLKSKSGGSSILCGRSELAPSRREDRVSKAMELIVAGFVKVKDRRTLAELLMHRRKVLADLQAVSGINPESSIRAVRDELAVIEAGLEDLKPPPGTLPENEF